MYCIYSAFFAQQFNCIYCMHYLQKKTRNQHRCVCVCNYATVTVTRSVNHWQLNVCGYMLVFFIVFDVAVDHYCICKSLPLHLSSSNGSISRRVFKCNLFEPASHRQQRIDALIRRAKRCGYYDSDLPLFDELGDNADEQLFDNVRINSHHTLHNLPPPRNR